MLAEIEALGETEDDGLWDAEIDALGLWDAEIDALGD